MYVNGSEYIIFYIFIIYACIYKRDTERPVYECE